MHSRLSMILKRLLPRRISEDIFEPAHHDVWIEHVSGHRRFFTASVIFLFLDCWRLVAADKFRFRTSRFAADHSSRERTSMLLNNVRYACRMLRREPGFTAAVVLTLALGVGGNVAVFAVIDAVLLRPLPYASSEDLVILNHRDLRTGITKEFIAIGDFIDLSARQSLFENLTGYGTGQGTVFGEGEPFRIVGLSATSGLYETFGIKPALGRGLQPEDCRQGASPVIIIGYDLWQTRFGSDPNIVGRTVKINQSVRQIVGVAPPAFHFPPNARTEFIAPITLPASAPVGRKNGWIFAVARLRPNVALKDSTANLATVSKQLENEFPQFNLASEYYSVSLRDALVGNAGRSLLLLFGAVGVVLLIACANVANLLLARSLGRSREMAMRVVLGAGVGRLASQLLVESLMLAVLGGAAGALSAHWGARALVALIPDTVQAPGLADVRINGQVILFAFAISIGTAIVFSLVSILMARRATASGDIGAPLRVSMSGTTRRAASGLVVAEVALAIVLLIGLGLILRSFNKLLSVDPGFRSDGVLTVEIALPADRYNKPAANRAFYDNAFAKLKALPQIQQVGAAVVIPLTGNNWTVGFERPERPVPAGERAPDVGWQSASGGYFQTMQIPLLAGRLFDGRDRPDTQPVVIISEAIQQKFFKNESAVGKQLKVGDQTAEIVGVVGNIRRAGLRDEPRADMYFPFERTPTNSITLFVRSMADPRTTVLSIQSVLKSIEPNTVFVRTQTLDEIAAQSVRETKLALWLLAVFGVTALALCAVGIYGVMSYVVRQRTRELGTRMALGATRSDILWLVMRQGTVLAIVGTAIGLSAGLMAARFLTSMLFGVSPSDPLTLVGASITLIATTLIACYIPARRAASVNAARTLSAS